MYDKTMMLMIMMMVDDDDDDDAGNMPLVKNQKHIHKQGGEGGR